MYSYFPDTKVIPVLTIEARHDARALATALASGGLVVQEVTLRTQGALRAVESMAKVDGVVVGVGTVLSDEQAQSAADAGAKFIVCPGDVDGLAEKADSLGLNYLPGCATATEALRLWRRGHKFLKFFPAEAIGGVAALSALAAPLADIEFCPTGGISAANAAEYLSLPNVVCVGGSWVAPKAALDAARWIEIETLARAAAELD